MNWFKSFIPKIFVGLVSLIVFFVIFLISNLDFRLYILGLEIVLVILVIYGIINYIYYIKDLKKIEEIEYLKEKIINLESEIIDSKNAISQYFLTWTHQIKTPITALKLMLSDSEIKNNNQMRLELLQIENYTNLAMSFLKTLDNNKNLNISKVIVDEIISPILKRYTLAFINNKVSLEYKKIDNVFITDPNWLSILIEQVISNSLKYSPNGTIKIYIEDDFLVIKDNGYGIKSEDLPLVFNLGYSGFNGRLNEKSSGVGLYLVDRIAQRLGNEIYLESTYKQGSTFKIKIF